MLEKNAEFMDVLKEADGVSAEDMLMDLLKDRVDQKIEDAVKEVEARAEEAMAAKKQAEENAVKYMQMMEVMDRSPQ